MNGLAFRCTRGGLRRVLEASLLGGYDGAGAWSLVLPALRNADEQLLVESHEGLHHELQATSAWGLVSAMAKLLAARDVRPSQLGELFDVMVIRSTRTHELFATYLSTAATGPDLARALLADNSEYTAYLDDALALVPVDGVTRQLQESAIAATLRCVMAPLAIVAALDAGFGSVHRGRLVDVADTPDERLAAFIASDGPAGWRQLFAQIRADHSDLGGDLGGTGQRHLPDDDRSLDRLRRFEEEVLLRRCYEHVAACLAAVGTLSVAWTEQAAVAGKVIAEVASLDEALAARLVVTRDRRPLADDGLEYHRQRVKLREPGKCEIIDATNTLRCAGAFQRGDGDERYVCGIWLSGAASARQFRPTDAAACAEAPWTERISALVTRTRGSDGGETVHLGLLPASTTPGELQHRLGELTLVAVTSHASLLDPQVRHLLADDEPIFVVMDLPVAWHVEEWLRQGAQVRVAASPLEGLPVELWLAAFTTSLAPHLRFLSLGGKIGTATMIEHLMRRHQDELIVDNRLLGDGTELAVRAVLGTWRVLEQDSIA
jgi:hypothetical protein